MRRTRRSCRRRLPACKQYIVKSDKFTAGVSATDGQVLWKEALGVNDIATIPTPIVSGDRIFTTCSYRTRGGTCGLIEVTKSGDEFKPSVVWKDSNLFNHHGGVVLIDGYLYGHSDGDRKNNMKAGWVCIDFATGKEVWVSDKQEKGSLTYADGKLFCWGEKKDELVMIDASPKGWTEHGRFTPPKKSPSPESPGRVLDASGRRERPALPARSGIAVLLRRERRHGGELNGASLGQ